MHNIHKMTTKNIQKDDKKELKIPVGFDHKTYNKVVKAAKKKEMGLATWIRMIVCERPEISGY